MAPQKLPPMFTYSLLPTVDRIKNNPWTVCQTPIAREQTGPITNNPKEINAYRQYLCHQIANLDRSHGCQYYLVIPSFQCAMCL
mmetsp:Transcript_12727/g.20578  ORF Transcript_12727/g.20578 Transcript_12727/m.20578 type:complete len:84 (+) Transcript_12727:1694-1945(+)